MKAFETLNHQDFLMYVGAVGNCANIAKELVAINENEMATKMLVIADFYATALTAEVNEPLVGVRAVLKEGENLTFFVLRGRFGYETKVVSKILKEALKNGEIVAEGKGRGKRYSLLPA